MIQILNPNKESLMNRINACRGNVYMNLKDGSTCDLKNDPVALRLFQTLDVPKSGIFLTIEDPKDFSGFVQYLMEEPADAS